MGINSWSPLKGQNLLPLFWKGVGDNSFLCRMDLVCKKEYRNHKSCLPLKIVGKSPGCTWYKSFNFFRLTVNYISITILHNPLAETMYRCSFPISAKLDIDNLIIFFFTFYDWKHLFFCFLWLPMTGLPNHNYFHEIRKCHKMRALFLSYMYLSSCLTHSILNRRSHTIYWKTPISILGTFGYEIYIFLEKNG